MRDEKKTKARLIAELNELRGELTAGASGGGHPILFDRIPLGLFRCTRRGELLWANRTLAGTLGYEDPEGLTGIKLRSLFVHPRLRGDLFDRLKVGEGSEGYLAELKRSDGGTFRARLTVQPDPRVGEGAEVFDGLVEDLTGEREFEETLARRVKHSAVLATLSRELYAAETVQEVLEVAVERLAEIFPTYASVNLVEEHRRYLTIRAHRVASGILRFGERISGRRLANLKIPLYEDTVIAETIHSGHPTVCGLGFEPEEPVVETDLRTLVEALVEAKSPLRRFGAEIAERVGDVAFLGIPFTDSAGEVTGSITVLSNLPFAPDEYNLIKVSADIVGKALEQKRLSQELGESLERYRGVFLNTVLGIYRTTPDGRVLMANPALVRMLGYDTFEELSKRNLEKGYQPGYSRADFKRVMEEKGEIHGEESVWTRLDGTSLHVHENTRAVRDEKGKTLYYEGTVEDITERKRAEEDRDKHLREIRALFEGVYILLWSVREGADGELYYEQVNDAFAAVEGYTPDHYNGKPIADLHPPEECENIRNSFNWAKLGKIHTSEVHFGEGVDQRFFEIRIIPLTDPDGEIRRFIGAGSDITERKLAEEALRESEERYHSFWVNAPVGICLSDSHGRLTMVSPVLCAMTGYPEEELLGMELFELIAEGDERAVPIAKTMDTHEFEQLQSLFSGGPTELTLVKKDGGLLPVEFNIDFITEKGTLKYMITLVADITERKQTEEALRKSEEFNRAVIERSPLGVSVRNRYGRLLSCNEAWRRIWAVPEEMITEELTGERDELRFDERDDYLSEWHDDIRRVYSEGGYLHIPEAELQHPREGGARWVSQHFYAIKDERGGVDRVVIVTEDITDRKDTQKALAASEETYRSLHETTLALADETELTDVIAVIAEQATSLLDSQRCLFLLLDDTRQVLRPFYSTRLDYSDIIMGFEVPLGVGLSGRVAQTGVGHYINAGKPDEVSIHVEGADEEADGWESLISVPMFDGGRVLGVITLGKFTGVFSDEDLKRLGVFARQAEIAVKRTRYDEVLAKSEETYRSLYNTTLTLADETDLLKIIAVICDQATKQLDSIYSTYFTYDALDEVLIPFYSNAPREREAILSFKVPVGVGLSGAVAQSMSGAYSNYTDSDRPVVHVEGTDKDVDAIASVISEPVMDGPTLLGVITIGTEEKVYNDEDLAKLRVFARLASIAIKRAEKESALEQSEETYRTLYETTMTLADETDLQRVLAAIADNARGLMDAHFCNILSYDPEGKELVTIYTNVPTSRETIRVFHLPLGVGLGGLVAEQRRGAYSNYSDPDRPVVHMEGTDDSEEHRESVLAEPIMDSETLLGVFLIHSLDRIFTDDDLAKVRVFARLTSIALKRGQYIQALSVSEERFLQVAASSGDWIWEVDADGRYTYSSPVVEQVLGYAPDEVIGKHFYDFFVPEEREEIKRAALEAFAEKEPIVKLENRNVHKDGRTVILETNGVPLLSDDGELLGYRGLDRDITERKRAEEALRVSEERYRSIWTKSPVGICLSDRDGMLTMVNPVLHQMLDFDEEELIGRTFFDLLAPEGDDKEMASLLGGKFDTQVYKNELSLFSGKPTEMALVKKSGERLPIEVTIDFITRERSVQYMISLITDITERKEAEEALANYSADLEREVDVKTAELSAARRYLREVIDASVDLITVVDAQGRIEILNRTASTAMGYEEEELRGRSIEVFYFDHDRETFREMTRRLSEGRPSIVRQVDLRCKDGSPITVELSVSPLLDNEGNFTGSVAVGRDIRELEGLRRALLQSEKLAATGKLAADIAHEVNNPLGIITNYLQIAKQDLDSSSDSYRIVGIIEEEVQRIAQIISGLLDFYRPESAFLAAADVNQLIEDLLILVSIQLEKMGIEVEKDLGEDLPPVVVSPDQFRQVLLNLVTNAQDAMPDGGTLRIRTRRSEDRVVLCFSDSGGGIPGEHLPYIFDPFFTTKGEEGTGLGLSVSYGIIQSFDGIMEASSRPGEGTTITISLPARED